MESSLNNLQNLEWETFLHLPLIFKIFTLEKPSLILFVLI